MKKLICTCGRSIRPKEHSAFIFDGLKIECKKCGLKIYGSGYGYEEALNEIESKLNQLKKENENDRIKGI